MKSLPFNQNIPDVYFGNLIETDLIRSLHFPKSELLIAASELNARTQDIQFLAAQKNLNKIQLRIHFEDIEGSKSVITTIIGITDQDIIINKNLKLPIHRVVRMTVI